MDRVVRFLVVGGITTAIAYVGFMWLLSLGLHYSVAVLGSWPLSVITGFVLNRRFTFGIVGPQKRRKDFILFIVGSLLQLGVATVVLGILTQAFCIGPSLAFFCTVVVTTTFSFAFMSLLTFRRARY